MMGGGGTCCGTAWGAVGGVNLLPRGGGVVVVVPLGRGRGVNLSGGGVLMRGRRLVVTRLMMTGGGGRGRGLVGSVEATGLTRLLLGGGGGVSGTRMTVGEAEVQRLS